MTTIILSYRREDTSWIAGRIHDRLRSHYGNDSVFMDIDSIPVNFLNSIPATPFESKKELTPQRCLKALCLFRFVNPSKEIRVAGGREVNLRSLQPLSLYPANSMFVNGYLTTPGQDASDAHQMISDLGFELDSPAAI